MKVNTLKERAFGQSLRAAGLWLLLVFCSVTLALPQQILKAEINALVDAEKIALSDEVYDGGTVDFQIVLHNPSDSPVTDDVHVYDTLDPRLQTVSASAGASGQAITSTNGVTYTIYYIPPTSAVTLTLQAQVKQGSFMLGGIITNAATIDDSVNPVFATDPVTVTMAEYALPGTQIDAPWNAQRFTTRGTFTIRGRTWVGDRPDDFPAAPSLNPITGGSGSYSVIWQSDVDAIGYTLQEATNVHFSEIRNSWDLGVKFKSVSNPPGTYYYRVKVITALGESRWSNVQAVQVSANGLARLAEDWAPPPPMATVMADQPVVELVVTEVGGTSPPQIYQATVTPDPSGSDWWAWSYDWTLPIADTLTEYTIMSRARDTEGNYDPQNTDTVTVSIRNGTTYIYLPILIRRYPPAPYGTTLNLDSDDTYGNYQLSWSYNEPDDPFPPVSYRFQEATDANFTQLTINMVTTDLRHVETDKAEGTYYYRVRAVNSYGYEGRWSNVISVTVQEQGYFDDFSNNASGWPRKVYYRGDECPYDPNPGPLFDVNYENGSYRVKIMLNTDGCNNRRMGLVPSPYGTPFIDYEVQVQHRFTKAGDQLVPPEYGKAGLVFAANNDFSALYVLEWNIEGDCAVSRYVNTTIPTTILNFDNISYVKGWGDCPALGYPGDAPEDREQNYDKIVTVKTIVSGNRAIVSINGSTIADFTHNDITTFHQVGLMTGSWDRTPVESRFDNFSWTPY